MSLNTLNQNINQICFFLKDTPTIIHPNSAVVSTNVAPTSGLNNRQKHPTIYSKKWLKMAPNYLKSIPKKKNKER